MIGETLTSKTYHVRRTWPNTSGPEVQGLDCWKEGAECLAVELTDAISIAYHISGSRNGGSEWELPWSEVWGETVGISTGVTLFPLRMDEVPRGFFNEDDPGQGGHLEEVG